MPRQVTIGRYESLVMIETMTPLATSGHLLPDYLQGFDGLYLNAISSSPPQLLAGTQPPDQPETSRARDGLGTPSRLVTPQASPPATTGVIPQPYPHKLSTMGGSATAPRVENADISSKPRRRRRDGYFWQLIVLRIPVAFFAVGVIAYLVHYVQKWQGAIRRPEDADDPLVTRKDALGQSGLALSMASVSLAVAVWETVARVVPRYQFGPRPLGPGTIFFDLLVIGLGIPGWLFFAMAEYQTDPSYPTPWRQDQDRAAMMIIVFWILHCVMCIMGCSACCGCCGCGSTSSKQAAVRPAAIHPAQQQDLEQAGNPEPLPNYKQSTGLEEIEPAAISADPPSYPEAVRLTSHEDGRP